MANNPDLFAYVDLRIYDKTPDDIKNAAMATLAASMPEWEPHSTNVEVLLMEALAIEVAEAVFSINRLPQAMVEIFLGLFGIDRLPGVEPKTTVRFNVANLTDKLYADALYRGFYAPGAPRRAQLTLKERPGGACEFLDAENRCRIYAARPRQCRDFPRAWRVAGCPGLGPR